MALEIEPATRVADIYRVLRSKILTGELSEGAKLPSQVELCSRYNAPRHILRKALERLAKDNLIVSWQGRGAYVRSDHLIYEIGERTRFAGNMRQHGRDVRIEILPGKKSRRVPVEVFNLLQLSLRDSVLVSELLHYVDDVPTAIGRHYFDPKKFPDIQQHIEQTNSVPEAFLANGIEDYTRAATFVENRIPTATEALILNIPLSQPIMELRGQNEDQDGRIIEVTEAVVRGDRVKLKIQYAP